MDDAAVSLHVESAMCLIFFASEGIFQELVQAGIRGIVGDIGLNCNKDLITRWRIGNYADCLPNSWSVEFTMTWRSKIDYLTDILSAQEDIVWFQIAMDYFSIEKVY